MSNKNANFLECLILFCTIFGLKLHWQICLCKNRSSDVNRYEYFIERSILQLALNLHSNNQSQRLIKLFDFSCLHWPEKYLQISQILNVKCSC